MGRRKIEMVRNVLTMGFMAGGYPIDGKPKEKTEKMHPEIWKRYALFAIAILLAGVVAYFAFATYAPVKTATDPPEVKTAEVQTAENAAVNIATIDWQKKLETDVQDPNKKWAIDRLIGTNKALIPIGTKEIALTNSILLTEISVDRKNWVVSGYIENKGTTPIFAADVTFSFVGEDYAPLSSAYIKMLNNVDVDQTGRGDLQQVKLGQKLFFETHPITMDVVLPENRQKFLELLKTAPSIAIKYKG